MNAIVKENISLQLSEMEMLESMFPSEIDYDDQFIINDLKKYVEHGDSNTPPPTDTLSFRIKLYLDEHDSSNYLTLSLSFSFDYPSKDKIQTHVRSDFFDRANQTKINKDLTSYLDQQYAAGDLMAGIVVSWLQENGSSYFIKEKMTNKSQESFGKEKEESYVRLWIYSHHIYSKIKRKDILELARDYNVHGFSLPGKPGIMCLEGSTECCQEMWNCIKSWNWKKINVKFTETFNLNEFKNFTSFEEISFLKNTEQRDYHMDMGEFYKYLSNHKCDYIFKELFGFDKQ